MRLKKLEILGYRGFEHKVDIRFSENGAPTVFIGVNGAGKTAILESIVGCLKVLQTEILGKRLPTKLFQRSEVNINRDEDAICKLFWDFEFEGTHPVDSGFEIRKTIDPPYTIFRKDTRALVQSLKDAIVENRKLNIPIVAYYPTERIVLNPSLKALDISSMTQLDAWHGAFDAYLNYDAFFQWFRNIEDLENEQRLNLDPNFSYGPLQAVRNAISSIIEGFSNPRISRAFPTDFIISKKGQILSLGQLSHGEKMTISLVGDLARRLAIANPGLENPLTGSGVVMIDEVDLHLHPEWQRNIVRRLRTTFPNIQFILTTHSPLVINHMTKECIFLLEDGDLTSLVDHPFNSYGADIEDTLKIIQKVRSLIPEEVEEQLNRLFNLIDNNEIDAAKELLKQLSGLLDNQHPSLLKAETKIQFKELLD